MSFDITAARNYTDSVHETYLRLIYSFATTYIDPIKAEKGRSCIIKINVSFGETARY
jgi:hypothetical protein